MKVALIGTRGVPARYGGFETAVEEIGAGLVELGHDVIVYCRDRTFTDEHYRGMQRVVLPALHKRALETLSHAGASTLHALRHRPDAAVVYNAGNAPWVATLRAAGLPVALHIDGHDGKRAKWKGAGQRYYALATPLGVRAANTVIVDSAAMKAETDSQFGVDSVQIAYGATHRDFSDRELSELLATLDLEPDGYHLIVARFEPENQVCEMVRGYLRSSARLPLVVVGFAGYPGPYSASIEDAAARDPRVRLLGAVWDQPLLDALFAGCASYLHGHSVGGTNPSLLRAMVHGAPVIGYDCVYNRETTDGAALWFTDADAIGMQVEQAEFQRPAMRELGKRGRMRAELHYRWSDVAVQYDALLRQLTGQHPQLTSTSGALRG
jgi:glycosyltransferase involved in cell wall biosynthesis